MICGGILGFILSLIIPGRYCATVFLSTDIDYNKTGSLETLEEDRMLGITEDIINSEPVLTNACMEAGWDGCSVQKFRENMRITRTAGTWSLSILSNDPKIAASTALAWLNAADTALRDAQTHALRAEAYQKELDGVSECLHEIFINGKSALCPISRQEIEERIKTLSEEITKENTEAYGLSSAIRIGAKSPDLLQLKAASRTAAEGTILGAFVGLLTAFIWAWVTFTRKDETPES